MFNLCEVTLLIIELLFFCFTHGGEGTLQKDSACELDCCSFHWCFFLHWKIKAKSNSLSAPVFRQLLTGRFIYLFIYLFIYACMYACMHVCMYVKLQRTQWKRCYITSSKIRVHTVKRISVRGVYICPLSFPLPACGNHILYVRPQTFQRATTNSEHGLFQCVRVQVLVAH